MADKESWDDEVDNAERDETEVHTPDSVDIGAATHKPHAGAPAGAPAEAPAEPSTDDRDTEQGASRPQEQDLRAKRAQRTRRIKINSGGASAAASGSPPTPGTPPQPDSVPNNKPANKPQNSPAANKKDKPANNQVPNDQSTPITIPPQVSGFQNHDMSGDEIVDFDEDEPSKLVAGLSWAYEWFVDRLKALWSLLKSLAQSLLKVLMFPALLGGVLYIGLVYLVGTYLLGTEDVSHLDTFEERLKSVLLTASWTVTPVFAAFAVIHFAKNNEKHHQFLYESVIDAVLQVFNGLVLTSHATPQCIVWVSPVFVISAIFRFLYWVSLFYLGNKCRQAFKTPAIVNCIVLSANNLGASLRHSAQGFLTEHAHDDEPGEVNPPTDEPETQTNGQGWFAYQS